MIPIGIVTSVKYRLCECLPLSERLSDCHNGVDYIYDFNVTCPNIDTFYVPIYDTPCGKLKEDIEKYRWDVGAQKSCWVEISNNAITQNGPEMISATGNATGNATNATNATNVPEPTPHESRTELGYQAIDIAHDLKGVDLWATGFALIVLGITIVTSGCVWGTCIVWAD